MYCSVKARNLFNYSGTIDFIYSIINTLYAWRMYNQSFTFMYSIVI